MDLRCNPRSPPVRCNATPRVRSVTRSEPSTPIVHVSPWSRVHILRRYTQTGIFCVKPPAFIKPVVWVGPSRRELKALPREVQRAMGMALWQAQNGAISPVARLMRGSQLHGVVEVSDDYGRRTFRMMYTTMFDEAVYVLCAFPKKSTRGVRTPQRLLALVASRLHDARTVHAMEVR